jgi:predicted regulator of Ras-like GTPase activity (Roadblock/LC7/MglB family)
MSFQKVLETIVEGGAGILAAGLMDGEGLPIAESHGPNSQAVLPDGEISSAVAEFGRVLGHIAKASDAARAGAMLETVVSMERFSLIFTPVEPGVVLVLALQPDGSLGKARYLMRQQLLAIRQLI